MADHATPVSTGANCGWCLTGDHIHHHPGDGTTWSCRCTICEKSARATPEKADRLVRQRADGRLLPGARGGEV